jgi:hypothetical protein
MIPHYSHRNPPVTPRSYRGTVLEEETRGPSRCPDRAATQLQGSHVALVLASRSPRTGLFLLVEVLFRRRRDASRGACAVPPPQTRAPGPPGGEGTQRRAALNLQPQKGTREAAQLP